MAQTPWLAAIGSILSQMASQLAPKRYAVIVLRTMAGTGGAPGQTESGPALTAAVFAHGAALCLVAAPSGPLAAPVEAR